MNKTLSAILLVVVIGFSCFYIVFYIAFNFFLNDNYLNTHFRTYFIRHQALKRVFRLHQVGDARYSLAGAGYKQLKVVFYLLQEDSLEPESKKSFTQEAAKVIGKEVVYESRQMKYPPPSPAKDEDLRALSAAHRGDGGIFSQSALLRVFVLNEYAEVPSYSGLVLSDDVIYIFKKPIEGLANGGSAEKDISVSVLLHEFAHLLGAEHLICGNCIMSEKIENGFFGTTEYSSTYTAEDLAEIRRVLGQF